MADGKLGGEHVFYIAMTPEILENESDRAFEAGIHFAWKSGREDFLRSMRKERARRKQELAQHD